LQAAVSNRVIANRYRLEDVIGKGVSGEVFAATDGADRFAVKVLSAAKSADPEQLRARFQRECEVCRRLQHEHLMPIVDHGLEESTGTLYLVMPLLAGEDLGSLLAREGALDPRVAVPLLVQACDGMAAAHAAGVVHRDIKPSNLFVENRDGELRVRVADFGLAKEHGALMGLTVSGAFMGTPHYTSPEQAVNAKHADERTDVWGLAMTLYHALAGAPAFGKTGNFMNYLVELTRGGQVPALQKAAPWVDGRLARVVHGALLRDLDARCPNAVELRLALEMSVGIDAARAPVKKDAPLRISDDLKAEVRQVAVLPNSWNDLLRG